MDRIDRSSVINDGCYVDWTYPRLFVVEIPTLHDLATADFQSFNAMAQVITASLLKNNISTRICLFQL